MTNLEHLVLSFNALSGPIPPELGKLSHLRELRLWNNRLNSLPPELRSVAGAETLCPADSADNPGLRADCDVLLATRDILAGEARLNWSEHLPIESWQGVTIGGSPDRVTRLELASSGLNGRIPPALGRLSQLVSLDLSRNRLTGPVPPELQELEKLILLRVSGNNPDRRTNKNRPDAVRRLFCRPSSGIASDLQSDCALLLTSRDVLAGDARLN